MYRENGETPPFLYLRLIVNYHIAARSRLTYEPPLRCAFTYRTSDGQSVISKGTDTMTSKLPAYPRPSDRTLPVFRVRRRSRDEKTVVSNAARSCSRIRTAVPFLGSTRVHVRILLGAALCLVGVCSGVARLQAAADAEEHSAVNLLLNPSFEQITDDGAAPGWDRQGDAVALVNTTETRAGERCYQLEIPVGGAVSVCQKVDVEPRQPHLFSLWVRSNGRVVADVGTLSVAYHRQGTWQKIAGVALSDEAGSITVKISCRPLGKTAQRVWIDDAVLRKADPPATPQRKGDFSKTTLVGDGKAAAVIVYPSAEEQYRVMADRIAETVRAVTGVDLPVLSDRDATAAEMPVLQSCCRNTNLILLGRLGINRAMWPAYNHFLCATDGYYPGGDGYVIRTAANVFADGHNQIILGGSSDRGARRAVDQFIQVLSQRGKKNTLSLPYLLDVELGGDCRKRFEERDKIWRETPDASVLPPVQPGYGSVRRWYENAMGYYWSGWDSYRQRAEACLERILNDKAYTHHYLIEFLVRAARMLGQSPVIDDQDRRRLDALILGNFWEFMYGRDVQWFRTLSPPYDDIKISGRHTIAPLMAELVMTDYLNDHLRLAGELRDIVTFRLSEKASFLDHMVSERWGPSVPGGTGTAHEEIVATMFRYALEAERYGFFNSGRARRALYLDMIDQRSGRLVRPPGRPDTALLLGMTSHYYKDGRYLRLLNTLPHYVGPTGRFMGRYIHGVHRYVPGRELAEESLAELTGVRIPETMPHVERDLPHLTLGRYRHTGLEPEEIFDFAAFRGGFEPDDDYMVVSGVAMGCAPGAIIALNSDGYFWLKQASESYFGQNALHVVRTDRFVNEQKPYPSAAILDWSNEWSNGGAVAFTLKPFVGTRWRRSVTWIDPGVFIVRDRVTPLEDGEYNLSVNWHLNGVIQENEDHYTVVNGSARMRVSTLGKGIRTRHSYDGDEHATHLRLIRAGRMNAGEPATMITVLQVAHPDDLPMYKPVRDGENRLLLRPETDDGRPMAVSWNGEGGEAVAVDPDGGGTSPAVAPRTLSEDSLSEPAAAVRDESSGWEVSWEYTGLQRPARIRPVRRISDQVVDLGRVLPLDEIRVITRGPWHPARFEGPVFVAVGDESGKMPPLAGDGWHEIEAEPQWREGIRAGNYGEAVPVEKASQYLDVDGLEARYVQAKNVDALVFYERTQHEARRPLTVEIEDVNTGGHKGILVRPRPYPKFYRSWQLEDDAVALLSPDGSERFQHEPQQRIQCARLLDYFGTGCKHLVLATVDARIQVFTPDGQRVRDIDMYQMHRTFDETEGRPNTRHPAGLYTMPYSVGLWRRAPDGTARMLVSRYQGFSFIDHEAQFEGVLLVVGGAAYVIQQTLPEGADFDGDGNQEQICLSHGCLWRVGGDDTPYVAEPNGAKFYPQVYRCKPLREPDQIASIEGPPTFVFSPVALDNGTPRHVLVTRANYVGVYDGEDHRWTFTWVPLVQMTAAAAWRPADGKLCVSALTEDGLLWTLCWRDDPGAEPQCSLAPFDAIQGKINAMAATDAGILLFATSEGLFCRRDGQLSMIAAGAFTDVAILHSQPNVALVAVRSDGTVVRLDETLR